MFCNNCGKELRDIDAFCSSCGTKVEGENKTPSVVIETSTSSSTPTTPSSPLNGADIEKTNQAVSVLEILMDGRILAFVTLVGAILVLVGLFTPWISASSWVASLSASAWDSVTTADILNGEKAEREGWATLALIGTIMTMSGSLSSIALPKIKLLCIIAGIGGVLAVVGALWAFSDIDEGSVGGISVSWGTGLYLTLVGGIICFVGAFLMVISDPESRKAASESGRMLRMLGGKLGSTLKTAESKLDIEGPSQATKTKENHQRIIRGSEHSLGSEDQASKIVLLKDSAWSAIDGELCRVTHFATADSVVDMLGKVLTPYAYIDIECNKLGNNVRGYITHKEDFHHLWAAFKDRKVEENEEVLRIWTRKHYRIGIKPFSSFMPKLRVMIFPKGSFELLNESNANPELPDEARRNFNNPIVDWKPDVMK